MGYYLKKYGKNNTLKFQEGGEMPAEAAVPPAPEAAPEAGAPEGGGNEEQLIALAEAATQGDQQAAMELGMALAPMIMEQAAAMGGGAEGAAPVEQGAPAPAEGGTPVFKQGGSFIGKA